MNDSTMGLAEHLAEAEQQPQEVVARMRRLTTGTELCAAIEFKDVELAFDDVVVLDKVNFRVRRGETKIVLGGSGTGKSTIINLVLGLLKPDAGRICIDGEDVTDYDEQEMMRMRKKIGMVFQEGALFDSLSVYENVAYRLHEEGVDEDEVEHEVRRMLRFVNLEDAIDKMPIELSGGMRRRVGVAPRIGWQSEHSTVRRTDRGSRSANRPDHLRAGYQTSRPRGCLVDLRNA